MPKERIATMTMFNGYPVKIAGTGRYIPEKVRTNSYFEEFLDTNDEWIRTRTGIIERHVAAEGEECSDLAAKAALDALKDAGISAEDIDVIIVSTNTPEMQCPCISGIVHGKIGATKAAVFDIFAGCTGSLAAIMTAVSGIATGVWNNALIIAAESFNSIVDWTDRNTCILFGDGAGACVLTRSTEDGPKFIAAEMTADGSKYDLITIMREEGRSPSPVLSMKGQDVFRFVSSHMPQFVKGFCEKNGVLPQDIDFWVLHQANARIIDSLFRRLSVSQDRTYMNMFKYGNTSTASLLITLDEVVKAGHFKRGAKIMFTAFGAGMTFGSMLYEA